MSTSAEYFKCVFVKGANSLLMVATISQIAIGNIEVCVCGDHRHVFVSAADVLHLLLLYASDVRPRLLNWRRRCWAHYAVAVG